MNQIEAVIYIIRNKINNKFYLGSTNTPIKRKSEHFRFLRKKTHHSPILQNAYNKYGKENLEFIIFQFCYLSDKLELEQYYLDLLKPEYNISLSSTAPMQGRKHSKETMEKFKSRPTLKGQDSPLYGTKWSDEFRAKVLASRVGYKHSIETKLKMRQTSLKLNRGADLDKYREQSKKRIVDSVGNVFESLSATGKYWNISTQTVCDILKGRHTKTRKGISFKYE